MKDDEEDKGQVTKLPTHEDRSDAEEDALLAKSTRAMRFGQYRFVALIIVACAVLMVLSPIFNRFLEAYEAVVVIPPEKGRVTVITPDGMPREKRISQGAGEGLSSGEFIRKDNLSWNPRPVPLAELSYDGTSEDRRDKARHVLPELYQRYTDEWSGTVTEISYRLLPSRGGSRPGEQEVEYRMTIELLDGSTREMVIPESLRPEWLPSLTARQAVEELRKIFDGRYLEKKPLSWEPVLRD